MLHVMMVAVKQKMDALNLCQGYYLVIPLEDQFMTALMGIRFHLVLNHGLVLQMEMNLCILSPSQMAELLSLLDLCLQEKVWKFSLSLKQTHTQILNQASKLKAF